jgi:carbon monoxide dehydrogenase subunit G
MRGSSMSRSKWLVVVAAVAVTTSLSGCDAIMGYFRAQREATKWEGPVEEITFAKLDKDGKVFDIELHSRVDAPIDKVWQALKEPEKLSSMSEQYKKSELISAEGNKKQLDINVLTLGNLQNFKIELTFHDDTKTVDVKTLESTIADIDGTYHLEPSPDGAKTLYIYKAKQTDKVNLPVSTDVQRSAIKESFVSQVNAIKKQVGAA